MKKVVLILFVLCFIGGCGWISGGSKVKTEEKLIDRASQKQIDLAIALQARKGIMNVLILLFVGGLVLAYALRDAIGLVLSGASSLGYGLIYFFASQAFLVGYVTVGVVIAGVAFLLFKYRKGLTEVVRSVEPHKTDQFRKDADAVQSALTKKMINKIRKGRL
jgi:hypothetical protein